MTADTPRLDQSLIKATRDYFSLQEREKTIKEKKEKARNRFFSLATKKVAKRKSLRRSEEFIETPEMSVNQYVERFFPTYKLEGFTVLRDESDTLPSGHTRIRATLVEDPSKAKFTFVNPENGKTFGRTYEMRGAGFNASDFALDHPELAQRCCDVHTKFSYKAGAYEIVKGVPEPTDDSDGEAEDYYVLKEKLADKIMAEEPETVAIFQQYAIPGTLNIKITPVRDATEDELNA